MFDEFPWQIRTAYSIHNVWRLATPAGHQLIDLLLYLQGPQPAYLAPVRTYAANEHWQNGRTSMSYPEGTARQLSRVECCVQG